jgi:uncharacterized RmlC-like cupin family protein
MKRAVQVDDVEFYKVDWGLTKNLVGPESMGSEKLKVNITEYLPGYKHKLHVHPTQEEEIGPGSVVFIPAGVRHATSNLSDSESLKAIIIKSPPGDEEVRM